MKGCSAHRSSILLLMIFFLTLSGTGMLKVVNGGNGCTTYWRFQLPNCNPGSCGDLCRRHGFDTGYCTDAKDACCCSDAHEPVKKRSGHAHDAANEHP